MQVICFLIMIFLAGLGHPGAGLAVTPAGQLEELNYRLGLGIISDVGQAHIRLTQEGPGRYRAVFAGGGRGFWKFLNRWLPERYETEMAWEGDRLQPLVYVEEFQDKGHHVHKEFRFDYSRGVLEIWSGVDQQKPEKKYQIPMKQAVYDPLSLFYNLRLGVFGPLTPGKTLRVALVPSPETREIIFRLGQITPKGLEVMLGVKVEGVKYDAGPYFILCTPQGVLLRAWTQVFFFGKVSGELLNPGEIMPQGLPALRRLSLQPDQTGRKN
jgi:hypothetical protein